MAGRSKPRGDASRGYLEGVSGRLGQHACSYSSRLAGAQAAISATSEEGLHCGRSVHASSVFRVSGSVGWQVLVAVQWG